MDLPRYICHQEVRAAKILGVIRNARGLYITFFDDRIPSLFVTTAEVGAHKPDVGMYLIRYDDGCLSFLPQRTFELLYTPVEVAA
jgi:hypothetical protein